MRLVSRVAWAVALGVSALAGAVGAVPVSAPAPVKPVDIQRYVGRWYEIGHLHNMLEEGCAGATADYNRDSFGKIKAVETCRKPSGETKVWRAGVRILDPGVNAKLRLSFLPFVSKEYWVIDHASDYAWAIVGTPEGKYLWLFSRQPQVSETQKSLIVARARALGYDTSRLIYMR